MLQFEYQKIGSHAKLVEALACLHGPRLPLLRGHVLGSFDAADFAAERALFAEKLQGQYFVFLLGHLFLVLFSFNCLLWSLSYITVTSTFPALCTLCPI